MYVHLYLYDKIHTHGSKFRKHEARADRMPVCQSRLNPNNYHIICITTYHIMVVNDSVVVYLRFFLKNATYIGVESCEQKVREWA